ncbi:MAG: P1 family peptidase [Planctomycetota bacterium]|nr:P1 family peptidase [Planctomycetota bacterium]
MSQDDPPARPRIRDLGISPGILPTGKHNAITDVQGVMVGHQSIVKGDDVRTGVTAIIPHSGDVFHEKVPAAVFVGNGFGKAAGFLQVQELGNIETPIVLTNTLSVGRAVEAVVKWTLQQPGMEEVRSVNAIVGETNDGYLNDIQGMHVTTEDVFKAIENAKPGPVEEGCVGAGVGTRCFSWKGGIGTSSRLLPDSLGGYTVGVLVQSNFGGILTIDGHRVGEALGRYSFKNALTQAKHKSNETPGEVSKGETRDLIKDEFTSDDGSIMLVIATDAPVDTRQLERMAKRAVLGLARTGSYMSNGSGDFVIAFSTKNRKPYLPRDPTRHIESVENDFMSPLFLATIEAVEEAVYNSLTKATTTIGRDGHKVEAIDIDTLREILGKN